MIKISFEISFMSHPSSHTPQLAVRRPLDHNDTDKTAIKETFGAFLSVAAAL
jgi:hypothetical protein